MRNTDPDPSKIAKLPLWAQQHISTLQHERDEAVRVLNEFQEQQKPSSVWYGKLTSIGEANGSTFKRCYIQTDRVEFLHAGISLSVFLTRPDDGQRDYGIELSWSPSERKRLIAFVPKGYQQSELIAQENMR